MIKSFLVTIQNAVILTRECHDLRQVANQLRRSQAVTNQSLLTVTEDSKLVGAAFDVVGLPLVSLLKSRQRQLRGNLGVPLQRVEIAGK